jgi:hypothetical protein
MPIVTPVCRADELIISISASIRSRNLFDARDQPASYTFDKNKFSISADNISQLVLI